MTSPLEDGRSEAVGTDYSGRILLSQEDALDAVSSHMNSLRRKVFVLLAAIVAVITTIRGANKAPETVLVLGLETKGAAIFVTLTLGVIVLLIAIVMVLRRLHLILDTITKENLPRAATRIGMHSSLLNPLPWFFARRQPRFQGYLGIIALYGILIGSLYAILLVGRVMNVGRAWLALIAATLLLLSLAMRITGKQLALAIADRVEELVPGMKDMMLLDVRRKHWLSILAGVGFISVAVAEILKE